MDIHRRIEVINKLRNKYHADSDSMQTTNEDMFVGLAIKGEPEVCFKVDAEPTRRPRIRIGLMGSTYIDGETVTACIYYIERGPREAARILGRIAIESAINPPTGC